MNLLGILAAGGTKGITFRFGKPKGGGGMVVESVLFDKKRWDAKTAKAWLRSHKLSTHQEPDTDDAKFLHFRQRALDAFEPGSIRTEPAGFDKK